MGRWIARAVCGRLLSDPAVTHLRGTHLRIEADTELPFEIDGDVGGTTPVEMRVRPRSLPLLRPTRHDTRRAP